MGVIYEAYDKFEYIYVELGISPKRSVDILNEKGKESYEPLIHIKNFFVQQVYTGPNGWKMNELATTVDYTVTTNVLCWWPYQAETIVNQVDPYDDIINNFNAGNCTTQGKQRRALLKTALDNPLVCLTMKKTPFRKR